MCLNKVNKYILIGNWYMLTIAPTDYMYLYQYYIVQLPVDKWHLKEVFSTTIDKLPITIISIAGIQLLKEFNEWTDLGVNMHMH